MNVISSKFRLLVIAVPSEILSRHCDEIVEHSLAIAIQVLSSLIVVSSSGRTSYPPSDVIRRPLTRSQQPAITRACDSCTWSVYRGGGCARGEASAPDSPQYGTTQWPQRSLPLKRRPTPLPSLAPLPGPTNATRSESRPTDIGGRTDAHSHTSTR